MLLKISRGFHASEFIDLFNDAAKMKALLVLKDKLRHMENIKSLWEQKSIWLAPNRQQLGARRGQELRERLYTEKVEVEEGND